jgi:hypothetical protein
MEFLVAEQPIRTLYRMFCKRGAASRTPKRGEGQAPSVYQRLNSPQNRLNAFTVNKA